jgi:hypothetical protein
MSSMRVILFPILIAALVFTAGVGLIQLRDGLRRGVIPLRVGHVHRSTRPGVFWFAVGAHLLGVLLFFGVASYLLMRFYY